MKILMSLLFFTVLINLSASATEYHVAITGNDKNDGSATNPYRTILMATQVAQPGDMITVHAGTYREQVNPVRGGISNEQRITYRAAAGEKVTIKGSEIITGWKMIEKGVWKATIKNTFFGLYNPYKDLLAGDWFTDNGKHWHTGEVYLNGKSLYESTILEGVLAPQPINSTADKAGSIYTWYCESDETNTYIYANFHDYDPNKELVEINARQSCFYPDQTGRNFITVKGFIMSQAATQWAPPTTGQIGLIGTNWSKGWIIEDNVISDSKCSGITLGKDKKSGEDSSPENPFNRGGADYNVVIAKALKSNGWSKDQIGSHLVRNNTIFNCEQAGICGSLGAVFSQITNNHIYNIWTKRLFGGFEIAGIKIHSAIDVLIKNNRIHDSAKGMWMDWMAQGTRITGNLCYNNGVDLFMEVNHGPYLVDNNIFLSRNALSDVSEGGAFVHNLIRGWLFNKAAPNRSVPYHVAHSTQIAGLKGVKGGDDRFYNNMLVKGAETKLSGGAYGLEAYKKYAASVQYGGNIYFKSDKSEINNPSYTLQTAYDPQIRLEENGENAYLYITLDRSLKKIANTQVSTAVLGKASIPNQSFENPDGSPLKINVDYFGKKRNEKNPASGPFENLKAGENKLKIW